MLVCVFCSSEFYPEKFSGLQGLFLQLIFIKSKLRILGTRN